VQWATQPAWGQIANPGIRRTLLDDGVSHLRAQLARENVRLVLLNGREVLNQVVAVGLADPEEVGHLPLAGRTCRLYAGSGGGIRWVAWSANLQSSRGVSKAFKQELGAWLAEICSPAPEPRVSAVLVPAAELDADGHLPRGLRVAGKTELVNVLRRWLAASRVPTLGDVSGFGGRAWLLINLGGQEVALNADTKRTAVETFVRDSSPTRSAHGGSSPTAAAALTRWSQAPARSPYPAGTPT
jgi:hypothetical protein